jgi:hypothetical protein
MNSIDYLVVIYIGWGIWQGWRKGLSHELPRLTKISVFVLTGMGLFRWTYLSLNSAANFSPLRIGVLSMPILLYCAFHLMRSRLKAMETWSDLKFSELQRHQYGAIAGFFRAAMISGFLIVYLGLWNLGFIHRTFAERSLFGRSLTAWILPVYQNLFEEEQVKQSAPEKTEASSDTSGRIPSTSSRK